MTGRVIFLLEEPSMKAFLREFLPRRIPGWRELEAWYLAQASALAQAYPSRAKAIARLPRHHQDPDACAKPSRELARVIPEFQKRDAARRLGRLLAVDDTRSASFRVFVSGVQQLVASAGGMAP